MKLADTRQPFVSADALLVEAKRAAARAYADYSGFRVGAAVLTAAGHTYLGCNVENLAYPLGVCAEAAALSAARVAEGNGLDVTAIAIRAEDRRGHAPCTPCGGCRQRILELAPSARVIFYGADMERFELSPAELLPHAFTFDPKNGR